MVDEIEFQELFREPLLNGVSYPSRLRGEGVPMINMREIFSMDRIGTGSYEPVPLTATEMRRYLLVEGDLLFARQSLTYEGAGKCSIVQGLDSSATWDSHIIRVRLDTRRADPRYYYYYFRSPQGRRLVETMVQQVAAAGIRGSDLRRLLVPSPVIHQQEAIADVLGALDDKIEANRKLAATALNLADAYFREVVANASEDVRLENLLTLEYGKALPATKRESGEFPVFGSGGVVGYHNEALVPGPGIIVGRKGSVGTVHWAESGFFPIDTVFYVVPKAGIPLTFLYFALRGQRFGERSTDSAVPGLNRGDAYRSTQKVPAERALMTFDLTAQNLFRLEAVLSKENMRLATLRDTLLPKLMSGQLRVAEAVELVGS